MEITCYDKYGRVIEKIVQWDVGQSISIKGYDLTSYAPQIHFANANSEKALVVESVLSGGLLSCQVPNSLARENLPIIMYIYDAVGETGKTNTIIKIPVTPRPMPEDVVYTDDVGVISLTEVLRQAREYMNNSLNYSTKAKGSEEKAKTSADAAKVSETNAAKSESTAFSSATQAAQSAKEAKAYVGSPLVANTISAMTDQTKVYVYTGSESGYTAGNWYYHNGSAWVSGGVYNSSAVNVDKTLTQDGYAADAKVTGDAVSSLKEELSDLDNSINGDSFLKTLATISTELFYNSYRWFIPLNLYSQGDTILIYFPTIANGTYSTYFCDESKSAVQAVEVTIVNHLASVVYPKFSKTYSFLRMPGEKETDLCYLKKKNATIFGLIDSLTQKNVMTLFVDNTGNTDVSHDVQMLINSMESDGEVEIYFPKGKYLFLNTIKHKKGNVTFRCAKGAEIIVNSSPIYTPFEIAGANVLPYSLGSFKIIGGYWTTSRTFGETGNPISTGFQVTKMEKVELIDAIFDELTQSNHLFDISGSKNVFIKGCTFRGMYFNPSQKPIGRDGNFEMIQIDLASGINLSICTENGHNECTKNVVIKDCVFEPSGKDNCYLYRPVGIHFGGTLVNNVVDWYDNIKIENNIFYNVLGRAIEVSCARNVSVKGNIFKQETEIIDGIIKCGSVRWGNTATWATFNGISDKQRYNCMNISILDNILSCSVDSDEMFIDAFPVLDTSSMYVDSSGIPLTKMAKNVTIKGNTGDLNIRADNIHMLNIDNNDVPNVYVDNNS